MKGLRSFAWSLAVSGLLIGCTNSKKGEQNEPSVDPVARPVETTADTDDSNSNQNSGIDVDDAKGWTMQGLSEYGVTDFIWDEQQQRAYKAKGVDTIYFAKRFEAPDESSTLELRLYGENRPLSDSLFWIKQSRALVMELNSDTSSFGLLSAVDLLLSRSDFSGKDEMLDVSVDRAGETNWVGYSYILRISPSQKPQTILLYVYRSVGGD